RAIEMAREAVNMQPDSALAQWLLGQSWYIYTYAMPNRVFSLDEATEQAIASYEKALSIDKDTRWLARDIADMNSNRAFLASNRGDDPTAHYAMADKAYQRALETASGNMLRVEVKHKMWTLKGEVSRYQFQQGKDPTAVLDEALPYCDDILEREQRN